MPARIVQSHNGGAFRRFYNSQCYYIVCVFESLSAEHQEYSTACIGMSERSRSHTQILSLIVRCVFVYVCVIRDTPLPYI